MFLQIPEQDPPKRLPQRFPRSGPHEGREREALKDERGPFPDLGRRGGAVKRQERRNDVRPASDQRGDRLLPDVRRVIGQTFEERIGPQVLQEAEGQGEGDHFLRLTRGGTNGCRIRAGAGPQGFFADSGLAAPPEVLSHSSHSALTLTLVAPLGSVSSRPVMALSTATAALPIAVSSSSMNATSLG